jgi:hypothetical protein
MRLMEGTLTGRSVTLKEEAVPKAPPRNRVIPPSKSGKRRKKGVRKPLIAFRCPDDLLTYIQSKETDRIDRTEVILKLLQVAKDAAETMGPLWWQVEYRANMDEVFPGVVLGQLAIAALGEKAAPAVSEKPLPGGEKKANNKK